MHLSCSILTVSGRTQADVSPGGVRAAQKIGRSGDICAGSRLLFCVRAPDTRKGPPIHFLEARGCRRPRFLDRNWYNFAARDPAPGWQVSLLRVCPISKSRKSGPTAPKVAGILADLARLHLSSPEPGRALPKSPEFCAGHFLGRFRHSGDAVLISLLSIFYYHLNSIILNRI